MPNPITDIIAQLVRHFLTIAAALLGAYGVSAQQQGDLVNSATAVIVAIVVFIISQVWAFKSKKNAYETPPA